MFAGNHMIGTLRTVAGALDAGVGLRGQVERWVGGAVDQPSSLPPSAVLVVRELQEVMPEPAITSPVIDATSRRTLRARLDRMAASAARPDPYGRVAASDAVVFRDFGELTACLALALQNDTGIPWWGAAFVTGLGATTASRLASILAADVPSLPAVMGDLARWRGQTAVLDKLTVSEVATLFAALTHTFSLSMLRETATRLVIAHPMKLPLADSVVKLVKARAAEAADVLNTPVATTLEPVKVLFLLTTDVLRARPELLRSSAFVGVVAAAVAEICDTVERAEGYEESLTDADVHPDATVAPEPPVLGEDSSIIPTRPAPSRKEPESVSERGQARAGDESRNESAIARLVTKLEELGLTSSMDMLLNPHDETPPSVVQHAPTAPEGADPLVAARPAPQTTVSGASAGEGLADLQGVPTRWGGVLYLINWLARFEFFSTQTFPLLCAMNPWACLELVARALLAGTDEETDPLWEVFAELGGYGLSGDFRKQASAGQTSFALPQAWLVEEPLPEAQLFHRVDDAECVLWRESGYKLYQGEIGLLPAYLSDLFSRSKASAQEPGNKLARLRELGISPDLMVELEGLVGYMRMSVASWLGVAQPEDARDLVVAALLCPGRVVHTGTHVDLVAGLNVIHLGIRRAGLDSDPGWSPEFARVVTFHFG